MPCTSVTKISTKIETRAWFRVKMVINISASVSLGGIY